MLATCTADEMVSSGNTSGIGLPYFGRANKYLYRAARRASRFWIMNNMRVNDAKAVVDSFITDRLGGLCITPVHANAIGVAISRSNGITSIEVCSVLDHCERVGKVDLKALRACIKKGDVDEYVRVEHPSCVLTMYVMGLAGRSLVMDQLPPMQDSSRYTFDLVIKTCTKKYKSVKSTQPKERSVLSKKVKVPSKSPFAPMLRIVRNLYAQAIEGPGGLKFTDKSHQEYQEDAYGVRKLDVKNRLITMGYNYEGPARAAVLDMHNKCRALIDTLRSNKNAIDSDEEMEEDDSSTPRECPDETDDDEPISKKLKTMPLPAPPQGMGNMVASDHSASDSE